MTLLLLPDERKKKWPGIEVKECLPKFYKKGKGVFATQDLPAQTILPFFARRITRTEHQALLKEYEDELYEGKKTDLDYIIVAEDLRLDGNPYWDPWKQDGEDFQNDPRLCLLSSTNR